MEVLNRSEISEEIRYVWNCPVCGGCNETVEDVDYEEYLSCEHCDEDFRVDNEA